MRRILVIWAVVMALWSTGAFCRPLDAEPMPTCASCRQPITRQYIQWGRQLFHPEHFVCAACGLPFGTAGYVAHQGRPYHQACYAERFAERCGVCGKPVTGTYVPKNGKAYHPACYAEAFAERCGVCGKPLVGRYIQKDGHSYHEACYQQALAEKCAVCGLGITGQYVVDPWGNTFHAAHQRQYATCEYCGRLITPRTTSGGRRYPDGRKVCTLCFGSEVSGDPAAQPIVETVRSQLSGWGLEVPREAAPVILVDRHTLTKLLRRTGHPGGPNVNGFTSVLTEKEGNRITKREMAVYVLYGMPREVFAGTVAHELTHVWINLNNGRRLDPAFEEGSCNYMKFLVHEQSRSDLAPYVLKAMQQDQDPAYGVGFRRVKKLVERKGLETLLTLLGRSTGFPLGY